jgi:SAM-dependent methyltransferase
MRESQAIATLPQFVPPLLSRVDSDWMVRTQRYRTRSQIAQRLGAAPNRIHVVTRYWWPARTEHLFAFAGEMMRWGGELAPGEWIYWVHPLTDVPITVDEAEQVIGLAARPELIEKDELLDGRPCLVVAGSVRAEKVATAVAWSLDLLRDDGVLQSAIGALHRCHPAIRTGLHFLGVPAVATPDEPFVRALRALAGVIDVRRGARLGVYVDDDRDGLDDAVRVIEHAFGGTSSAPVVCCQWRAPHDGSGVAREPRALFEHMRVDCSLLAHADGSDAPYVVERPYLALDFDLRRPAYLRSEGNVVSWPRQAVAAGLVRWCAADIHRRLQPVLERQTQLQYLADLERDRSKVYDWHHYHVYNWAPPASELLSLISCDAREVDILHDALKVLPPPLRGDQAVAMAEDIAREGAAVDASRARAAQIAAHEYLASGGRHQITADGEELIARLPDSLGDTLEIGFGYGLTAARVAARARRYVGIDLQTAQGKVLREYGGLGLVADIHWLPVSAAVFDTIIADNVLEHAADPLRVLAELRRVLTPGGRIYALIPPDGVTRDFQIRTHFWKSDEWSLREAAQRSGLQIVTLEMLEYAALGVYGCFPASGGRTCLLILQRPTMNEGRD